MWIWGRSSDSEQGWVRLTIGFCVIWKKNWMSEKYRLVSSRSTFSKLDMLLQNSWNQRIHKKQFSKRSDWFWRNISQARFCVIRFRWKFREINFPKYLNYQNICTTLNCFHEIIFMCAEGSFWFHEFYPFCKFAHCGKYGTLSSHLTS